MGWIAAQAEGNTGRDNVAGMVVGHKIRKGHMHSRRLRLEDLKGLSSRFMEKKEET